MVTLFLLYSVMSLFSLALYSICIPFAQVTKLVAQGFSADSVDGRQHSAISEAACQVCGGVFHEDEIDL